MVVMFRVHTGHKKISQIIGGGNVKQIKELYMCVVDRKNG